MEGWLGSWCWGSDEPGTRGSSLDTSCWWKRRGSTSTLRRIISLHTVLWKFKSLCVSVTKDADPFAHPLVLQHPACDSPPSLPHPFALWVMGRWVHSPKAPGDGSFQGSGRQQWPEEPPGACPHPGLGGGGSLRAGLAQGD